MTEELTLHACKPPNRRTIHVDWFDDNGVRQSEELEIVACTRPSRLEIRVSDYSDIVRVNGGVIVVIEAKS